MRNLILGVLLFLAAPGLAAQADYDTFATFHDSYFGAEKDSLVYVFAGGDGSGTMALALTDSSYTYAGENSLFVAFETNLPAKGRVAYGTSAGALNDTTTIDDRFYFTHNNWIGGLDPNTEYFFRYLAIDERGNTVAGDVASATTKATARPGVVYVDSTDTFPFVMSAGVEYVVQSDIDADTGGFVTANGATLDLNGYTLTYDNAVPDVDNTVAWGTHTTSAAASYGVHGYYAGANAVTVVNGRIEQGAQASAGSLTTLHRAFCPVAFRGFNSCVITGLDLVVKGNDVHGVLLLENGDSVIKHCSITSLAVGEPANRHEGLAAILMSTGSTYSGGIAARNLIKRWTHRGVAGTYIAHHNEVYIDSWATNAFAVMPNIADTDPQVLDNKIFGTGYMVAGVAWPGGSHNPDYTVSRNLVYLQGDAPTDRSTEYATYSSMNGLRFTQYSDGTNYTYGDILYEDNVVIVKAMNGTGTIRGTQFSTDAFIDGFVFRDNIVKTQHLDSSGVDAGAPVHLQGAYWSDGDTHNPLIYENSTFIGDLHMVRVGDGYSLGCNHWFRNCTFIGEAGRSDFETMLVGYWYHDSYGHRFVDCTFTGAADPDDLAMATTDPGGVYGWDYGHSLWITATTDGSTTYAAGDSVQVYDAAGYVDTYFADAAGVVRLELFEGGWYSDAVTVGMAAVDHGTVTNGDYSLYGFQAGEASQVVVDASLFAVEDNEASPVTIDFSTGGTAAQPPVAAFSGTPLSGEVPLQVHFTDASTGGPIGWTWTFGDGGTSTSQNPTHTYSETGTYSVTLEVMNADGSDSETKASYITVTDPVPVTFTAPTNLSGQVIDGG